MKLATACAIYLAAVVVALTAWYLIIIGVLWLIDAVQVAIVEGRF